MPFAYGSWESQCHVKSEVVKTVLFVCVCLVVVYLKIKIPPKLNRLLINLLPAVICARNHIERSFLDIILKYFYLSASLPPY